MTNSPAIFHLRHTVICKFKPQLHRNGPGQHLADAAPVIINALHHKDRPHTIPWMCTGHRAGHIEDRIPHIAPVRGRVQRQHHVMPAQMMHTMLCPLPARVGLRITILTHNLDVQRLLDLRDKQPHDRAVAVPRHVTAFVTVAVANSLPPTECAGSNPRRTSGRQCVLRAWPGLGSSPPTTAGACCSGN